MLLDNPHQQQCCRVEEAKKRGSRTGGLKVWSATSHLPEKMRKSANGVPCVLLFAVNTQKIDGSMWSCEIEPTCVNFSMLYLYGA